VFPVLQETPDLEQGVTFNLMNSIYHQMLLHRPLAWL
jgi:hypothetical protein